jgi:hypothetical protein
VGIVLRGVPTGPGSRYKLPGPDSPSGGPGPDYVAYVLSLSVALFVDCTN